MIKSYVYEGPQGYLDQCPVWWQHIIKVATRGVVPWPGGRIQMIVLINQLLSEFDITYDERRMLTAPSEEQFLLMVLKYS